jgi:hypothetical protein
MPKGKPNENYVTFTEELNALDYLEKAYEATRRFRRDLTAWKWVVISLHGALYSFAICALKGTDWTRVTWPGTRKLIAFDEAIKRCQSTDWMTQVVRSRPLHLTDDEKGAIRFLKHVRNQFEHYTPLAWSIEGHRLTTSAIDVLDVIRSLALDSGNVRLDGAQHQTVDVCTRKGKELLQSTQLYKDYVAALKRTQRKGKPSQEP